MSNLDESFKKLLVENIGYGFSMSSDLPVQEVEFPEYSQPQVDPNRPIVTAGETTVAGDEREDYAMEMGQDSTIEEVGNLVITIGYILNQAGVISDKYNVAEILDYLNHNFEIPTYPEEQNPEQMSMPNVPGDVCPPPEEMSPGYAYTESIKHKDIDFKVILESLNKKLI